MRKNGFVKTYQLNSEQLYRLEKNLLTQEELDSCLVHKNRMVSVHDLDSMVKRYGHQYVYASWFGLNADEFTAVMVETGEILFKKSYLTLKYLFEFLGFQMMNNKVHLYVK